MCGVTRHIVANGDMKMEELKEIAALIGQLGEAGKTAFIVWVCLNFAKSAIWAAVVGCAIYALLKRVGQAIANCVKQS